MDTENYIEFSASITEIQMLADIIENIKCRAIKEFKENFYIDSDNEPIIVKDNHIIDVTRETMILTQLYTDVNNMKNINSKLLISVKKYQFIKELFNDYLLLKKTGELDLLYF